jgi:23S rRNA (pseudouridine1915-N3)-methyltransferase
MRVHLVFIGKTAFADLDTGISRYLDRLRFYVPIQMHVVKAGKISPKSTEEVIKDEEAERILKLLGKDDYLVIWDQQGTDMDSLGFAGFLEGLRNKGISHVWMVVGGPLGISQKLLKRADSVLSLSRMTFPHDLARLMVAEQLYRAFTILKGEPYHK